MQKSDKSKENLKEKEDRNIRLVRAIEDMKIGEAVSPTPLANKANLHENTLVDKIDVFDSLKESSFKTIRDEEGNLKAIIRTDNSLDMKKEISSIKNDISEIKLSIDEIKLNSKKR